MAIRLGIIGAGAIGRVHANAAKEVAGIEATCVADVNGTAAKSFASDLGVPEVSTDPSAMLASGDIDAVVIGVPNRFHAPLAIEALNAGKHVLLEKPMALTVAECDAVNAAAAESKAILQMGFVHRYSAVANTARQLVAAGRLGDIYHAKANCYRRRGIPGLGGWFTTKAMSGGGPLIDLGVHILDLMTHLMGDLEPVRVSGKVYANFGKDMKKYVYESMWAGPPKLDGVCDVEDSAHAFIRFKGGVTLEMNTTWAGNFVDGALPNVLAMLGTKGGLTFQLGGDRVDLATEEDGFNVDVTPKLKQVTPFVEQMKTFAKSIEAGKAPAADGHAGRRVQALLDAIYESSERDREVEL